MRKTKHPLMAGTAAVILMLGTACANDRGGSQADDGGDFPSETLTFVVHAPAGGGSDTTSRALATELEKILGEDIVVENRTGGGGVTAFNYVTGQEPDGYTLGYVPVEVAIFPNEGQDISSDDFDLLGQLVNIPGILAVPEDSPYQTVEDLVAASVGDEISTAITGAGGIWDMASRALNEQAGAELQGVPFDGDAPAVAAVSGGQTDAVIAGVPTVLPATEDGLRALMVFSPERLEDLPDVPTAEELGYDLPFGGWGGVGAAAGLPNDVRQRLEEAIAEARDSEAFRAVIEQINSTVVERDGDEFRDFVEEQTTLFGEYL